MSKSLIVKKEKNKYLLYLNKSIFSQKSLQKVIAGEAWINKLTAESGYFVLDLSTDKKTDVLELANYVLYSQRSA